MSKKTAPEKAARSAANAAYREGARYSIADTAHAALVLLCHAQRGALGMDIDPWCTEWWLELERLTRSRPEAR